MSDRASQGATASLVEVLKSLGYEFRSLYDQAIAIKGGSDADMQRKHTLMENHFRHPVRDLCRLIEEATGIDRNVLEQVALRINTPLGLAPLKVTQPQPDPVHAHPGFVDDDPLPDVPDLRWVYPELNKCDGNGTTAKILRRFNTNHPEALDAILAETSGKPGGEDPDAKDGGVGSDLNTAPRSGAPKPVAQRRRRKRRRKKKAQATFPAVFKAFGIIVDLTMKTVCKETKKIEFERSEVQWYIFKVAATAYPSAYSLDDLKNGCPGENNIQSRKSAITQLNKKLHRVGVRIEDRTLSKIRNNS